MKKAQVRHLFLLEERFKKTISHTRWEYKAPRINNVWALVAMITPCMLETAKAPWIDENTVLFLLKERSPILARSSSRMSYFVDVTADGCRLRRVKVQNIRTWAQRLIAPRSEASPTNGRQQTT